MPILATIDGITGQSPYHIYLCQPDGTGCFFIDTITSTPYQFDIPSPYDNLNEYMIKVLDNNNCTISGTSSVL